MMELSEDFLKLLQTALLVIGLLVIFLIFISYNITVIHSEAKREAYVLGDYLLASRCLVLTDNNNVAKGLLSEEKLDLIDPSCINYPNGEVEINLTDSTKYWNITLGPSGKDEKAIFAVAVKLKIGEIKPATMTVTI